MRDGVIDIGQYGVVNTGVVGPVAYLIDPAGLPGGAHPFDLAAWYYVGDGEELSNKILQQLNLNGVWIGIHPDPAELFCHSNVKLESAEDFKGVPGIHSPSCAGNFAMNTEKWNELPDDLKYLLKDEFAAFLAYDFLECWYKDAIAMKNYEEYGTEIVVLSDEFQKAICQKGKEFCEKFAAEDPMFKEVYESQKAFFKTFRGVSQVVQPKYCLFD